MAMSPKQKTLVTVVAGVIVAVTPSFFSYLQSRDEIKAKYQQASQEADTGYKALVASVADLQKAVTEEHDYTVKLEGQITALTNLVSHLRSSRPVVVHPGVGSGSGSGSAEPPLPADVRPPDRPHFERPPANLDAAQSKR
jgi:hypothetical protein